MLRNELTTFYTMACQTAVSKDPTNKEINAFDLFTQKYGEEKLFAVSGFPESDASLS